MIELRKLQIEEMNEELSLMEKKFQDLLAKLENFNEKLRGLSG